MIVPMTRVRILGPRDRFDVTLAAVQDFGKVHLSQGPAHVGVSPARLDARTQRRRAQLTRVLADVDEALQALGAAATPAPAP
ncbi:MAG TPA: hypothetical protein VG916_03470, partial [Gemmatimonadaceae bacterium]|nr:hypothetical protein [Gemmatimonadaceae bacterium]